jgi:hypothetical protein
VPFSPGLIAGAGAVVLAEDSDAAGAVLEVKGQVAVDDLILLVRVCTDR